MRAWIEVDLGRIAENLAAIRSFVGPSVGVMGVVKADAYGHGIEPVAEMLDQSGIDSFAVIGFDEALRVRTMSQRPVLIMGYLDDGELAEAIEGGFLISLADPELAPLLISLSQAFSRPAIVHLKIETGLNRLGMAPHEALRLLENPPPELRIDGVFSHLSNSNERDEDLRQLARFQSVVEAAQSRGIAVHMTKSHALADFREGHFDFVRVGLALYGFEEVIPGLKPAMAAKTVIMQRKPLAKGEGVSYGKLFRAPRDMEIAVIAMGYAEGLSLSMSEKIKVLVNGCVANQIGRICMNLSVIDVTGIPATRGDEVVVVGSQGDHSILASDIAAWTGIRQHEIVTRLGRSLPKTYSGSGGAVD